MELQLSQDDVDALCDLSATLKLLHTDRGDIEVGLFKSTWDGDIRDGRGSVIFTLTIDNCLIRGGK